MSERTFYKFLRDGRHAPYNLAFVWPEIGEWTEPAELPLRMCSRGYHVTDATHATDWINTELYEVELTGARESDFSGKWVAERARLVRRVDGWNEANAARFIRQLSGKWLDPAILDVQLMPGFPTPDRRPDWYPPPRTASWDTRAMWKVWKLLVEARQIVDTAAVAGMAASGFYGSRGKEIHATAGALAGEWLNARATRKVANTPPARRCQSYCGALQHLFGFSEWPGTAHGAASVAAYLPPDRPEPSAGPMLCPEHAAELFWWAVGEPEALEPWTP